MTPHAAYLPNGEIRNLRMLLARRDALVRESRRWLLRAHSHLHRASFHPKIKSRSVAKLIAQAMEQPEELDQEIYESLQLCQRMDEVLGVELKQVDKELVRRGSQNEEIKRLMTIPGFGPRVASMVYAWIGDVRRFPSARHLSSYAGLVPSVRQSGNTTMLGRITCEGSPQLRSYLTQAAHVLMWRCKNEESHPLRAIAERIHSTRVKRKLSILRQSRRN